MIKALFREYKWRLVLATLCNSATASAWVGLIALVNHEVHNAGVDSDLSLTGRTVIYISAILFLFIAGFLSQLYLTKVTASLIYRLRTMMLQRVLLTHHERKEHIGGHRILASITTDIDRVSKALTVLPIVAFNVSSILLCFAYLAYLSVFYFFILFGLVVFSVCCSKLIINRGLANVREMREQEDGLFRTFKALVDGGKELAINENRRKHFYKEQAIPSAAAVKTSTINARKYFVLNFSWSRSMLFVCFGAIIYLSKTIHPVENEVLVGFIVGITYFAGQFAAVMDSLQDLVQGLIAFRKINSLEFSGLTTNYSYTGGSADRKNLSDNWRELRVCELCYQYKSENDDYNFSIGPIDLTIHQGEVLFICGGNGSGKSTFAKLLIGLYTPTQGNIFLGNTRITGDLLEWYQNHISTIFSDFYLFEHILDAEGKLADTSLVEPHLKKLHLNDKISAVDGKLSTTDLSHGQRKRLALLLAYIEDSQIYVFDEWAADQDPYFRRYFYTHLLSELKNCGKTVIVISHDDRYFNVADRVIQFNNGQAKPILVPTQESVA